MTSNEPMINDYKLTDLIGRLNFIQSIYYLWTERMPSKEQEEILQSCFIALIDHGIDTPSSQAALKSSTEGHELHENISAGLLATGKEHGTLPIKESAELFEKGVINNISAKDLVIEYLSKDKKIPGFGHRIYEKDPRTEAILNKLSELGVEDEVVAYALKVEAEIESQKGTKLCLNIDGMIGALLNFLEIDKNISPAIFIIARSAGLAKQLTKK